MTPHHYSPNRKAVAWFVHLYTASGGILGMVALFAAAQERFRDAFLIMVVTTLIDATDGLLARMVRVWEVLPSFDGAMVDNVIDVLTFVWLPVFIIWRAELLPNSLWLVAPILAALYAYGQVNMKTDDSFFLGFPSYWNVVALYLYWLQPAALPAVLLILIPAVLSFVPTRYLYPSKNQTLSKTTWGLALVWVALTLYLLACEEPNRTLVWVSFFYPVYYLAASFYVDWQLRRRI
jgi:phosphatidylcholine synthase